MNRRQKKVLSWLLFFYIMFVIWQHNFIINNSYSYYLKAYNLKDTKANYSKFCDENAILFAE